jgi:peroxiredoxin
MRPAPSRSDGIVNPFSSFALRLAWLGVLGIFWLAWQLLRQNGRILLRLDELEKRLDTLEFGEDDQQTGLSLRSEAPAFELPDVEGNSHSLARYKGQSVLLIFFNPACGFCRDLVPKLAALSPEEKRDGESKSFEPLTLLVISTGDVEANRQLFNEHKLSCPVLLQKEMEVAAAYKSNGTPSGYLISPEGKIASGLAIGAEALLEFAREPRSEKSQIPSPKPQIDESLPRDGALGAGLTSVATGNGDNRSGRFSTHSVARSKIKRDGLKAGTPAPDFRLSRLDGRGELSLSDFRGQRVLLVFSSPDCGPCNTLAPKLEKFHRANPRREPSADSLSYTGGEESLQPVGRVPSRGEHQAGDSPSALHVIMISKGEPKENRAKVKEHGLTFPIVLQQQWEISRRYAMFATPIAYLIDEGGVITRNVAVGIEAIQILCDQASKSREHVVPVMS